MTFSATNAAFEGFRLAKRSPMTIVWWSLAYLVMMVVAFFAVGSSIPAFMVAAQELEGATNPQMEDFQALVQLYTSMIVWLLPIFIVFGTMLNAAVARSVLRPDERAFGYLRLGADELRVLLVSIVLGLLGAVAGTVLFGLVGVAAGFVASSGQNAMWLLVVLLGIAAFVAFVWLSLRFSLAIPITIAERRMAIFDSFSITKGRSLPLLGMAIIAVIMSLLVSILGSIISLPITMMTGGLTSLAGMEGAPTMEMFQAAAPALIGWVIVNAIMSALQLAIIYAPFAAAYRDIKGQ